MRLGTRGTRRCGRLTEPVATRFSAKALPYRSTIPQEASKHNKT